MNNKEKNFVSAVVYVYNSENRIADFLNQLINVFENGFEHSEIILVNDSSADNSLEVIQQIGSLAKKTSISIVNMSCFHGVELAMKAGIDMSIGDFVFEFDNTYMDYDSLTIMQVYNRSLEGYDIVSASPDKKEKLSSRIFYNVFEYYSQMSLKMSTESFRILSRRVINRISSMNKSIPYRKAIYSNCGLKTDNIKYEVVVNNRCKIEKREQKYRSALAINSLIIFTDMGYQFSKAMSLFMMFMVVAVLVYSISAYLLSNPVAGWTSTILFLAISFFGLFGILTIVIKYLQVLVDLNFKRKQYNFESIQKITK